MDAVGALQEIAVVNRVCGELDNHLGFSDKTLAEFIIHLAVANEDNINAFQQELKEAGADFPVNVATNLHRIIMAMKQKAKQISVDRSNDRKPISQYPSLAIPNTKPVPLLDMHEEIISGPGAYNESKNDDHSAVDDRNNRRNKSGRNGGSRSRSNDPQRGSDKNQRRSRSRSRSDSRNRNSRRGDSRDRNQRDSRRGNSRDRNQRDSRRGDSRDRNQRDSRRGDSRDRNQRDSRRGDSRDRKPMNKNTEPELYGIYDGKISNIMDFGCFVELDGFASRKQGLVHIGQVLQGMVRDIKDVCKRNQRVKVKVISIAGSKMSLSMKEVDQNTGADLFPSRSKESVANMTNSISNPVRPISDGMSMQINKGLDMKTFRDRELEEEQKRKRGQKKMSDNELWEAQQLIKAGVLSVAEYPTFDSESGMGLMQDVDVEEDIEIELNEDEAAFLRGQSKKMKDLSPVRVVKNPDGTMQRAALQQAQLSKERREIKQAQANNLIDAIPKDLSKPWEDPMPDNGERHLAHELKSINVIGSLELPEWKQKTKAPGISYGIISNKTIKEQRESLPVFRFKEALCRAIAENQILVVIGATGSGKTTQMTQYMIEMGYGKFGVIGCTQPRRVAATSIAKRVAEEYGCQLGQEVGYSIRFEDCTSPSTIIKYMTDGMLMREYLADNSLSKYIAIILDEAHERTIHTDVLFGLLKNLMTIRKDLKLIVTSATLDADKFCQYFFNCPRINIPGNTFNVVTHHVVEPEPDYMEATLMTVMNIHLNEPAGDILVFLTGQEEIDTCAEILYGRIKALGELAPELIILPIYSSLPSEMQSRVFEPAPPGSRKCVIATNIAEASLTIDGIYYVVDPGFCKQNVFNPKLFMDSLVITPISQASARQRTGRAGRTGPGVCYRLYTEHAFLNEMLPSSIPEIQRTNLGNVVLQLKAMGINDLIGFDFMDPPPVQTLIGALEALYNLGALDDEGLLTKIGRKMAEFPLEPSLSKMLIISSELGCSDEILTIVAMLSVENPFYRPKEKAAQADQKKAKFFQAEGDHITLLAVYQAWAAAKFSNPWCFDNFLQARSLRKAQEVRKQLVTILDRYKMDILSCGKNTIKVRKCIVAGFFFNAAKRDPQEGYKTMVDNQPVFIHPASALFQKNPEWVIYHELVLTTKEYMRNVLVVDPKWLIELAPKFFKQGDPTKISKTKAKEKIEPLFDKHNPKDSWRLSKRPG